MTITWNKSTYCDSSSCVEWRKSTYCEASSCVEMRFQAAGCENGTCVQVASCGCGGGTYQLRDSKNPDGPILTFDKDEWEAFVAGVKAGEFD